jgi:hypothetical protein
LEHVVIGGFSVIFHGHVRATRDSDLPLDFATVFDRPDVTEWEGQTIRVAALPSVVGFKRLARRPQDRVDLEELEAIHGALPIEPIPDLDS